MTLTKPIWTAIATPALAGALNPCSVATARCTPISAAFPTASCFMSSPQVETIPLGPLPRAGFHAESLKMTWDALRGGIRGLTVTHPDEIARQSRRAQPSMLRKIFQQGWGAFKGMSDAQFLESLRPLHDFLLNTHQEYAGLYGQDQLDELQFAAEALLEAFSFEACFADGQLTEAAKKVAFDAVWTKEDDPEYIDRLFAGDRMLKARLNREARNSLAPIDERGTEQGVWEALQQEETQLLEGIPEAKRKAFTEVVAFDVWQRVQKDKPRYYASGEFTDSFRNLVHVVALKRARQKGWI